MSYVSMSGPLFDRRRGEVVRLFLHEADRQIAEEGRDLVRDIGQKSFRYHAGPPTYHFRDNVRVSRSFGGYVVRDDVIYGPWLEGVSQRNTVTRFKGYSLYRRAAQLLNTQAHLIAQRVLPLYLRMLGGK